MTIETQAMVLDCHQCQLKFHIVVRRVEVPEKTKLVTLQRPCPYCKTICEYDLSVDELLPETRLRGSDEGQNISLISIFEREPGTYLEQKLISRPPQKEEN